MEVSKLIIAIPTRGSMDFRFVGALLRLIKPVNTKVWMRTGPQIDLQRNNIVKKFLETKANYLLFLDDDIIPPQNGLTQLLSHKLPIVSGLYWRRSQKPIPIMFYIKKHLNGKIDLEYKYSKTPFPQNQLVEVDACGAGFLLIHREVLANIKHPWFVFNEKFGEDINFCLKAKKNGYKIFVDTGLKCLHLSFKIIGES